MAVKQTGFGHFCNRLMAMRSSNLEAARVEMGLLSAANYVLNESRKRAPFDITALKRSSRVRIEGKGFDAVAYIGYGIPGEYYLGYSIRQVKGPKGAKTPELVLRQPELYALAVHERLDLKHEHGEALFLKNVFTQDTGQIRAAFVQGYNGNPVLVEELEELGV